MKSSARPARVTWQPEPLAGYLADLGTDAARTKYGALRRLRTLSEQQPAVLYPEIDVLIRLLDANSKILQWGAIIILGNLAAVDSQGRLDKILDRFLTPIRGPVMITAANTITAAGKIAAAKPKLADKIARAILQVETARYQTAECRNVAIGHALLSLDRFIDLVRNKPAVLDFARRQLQNSRHATQRKAAALLAHHSR